MHNQPESSSSMGPSSMGPSSLAPSSLAQGVSPIKLCALVLLVIAIVRLTTLGTPALLDATEGRYASIAQTMVQSGDWITPQIRLETGTAPFWGKPPLHFWLTAASLKVFGMNEWAARFAGFVPGSLMVLMTWFLARRLFSSEVAWSAALLLSTSVLLFFMSGSVTIDVTLSCCITGALLGFAMAIWGTRAQRYWGLSIFLWLAFGFLTKGPVAIVLVAAPIGLWTIFAGSWRRIWSLPWFSGTVLFLTLVVPWFALAERATPGFLNYFFYEENFRRFLTEDYLDRYGSGHRHMYGMAWGMLAIAFLPWTIPLLVLLVVHRREIIRLQWRKNEQLLFLVFWGISAGLFFTFARQILINYLIPALPALAILLARQLCRAESVVPIQRILRFQVPILLSATVLVFLFGLWDAPRVLSIVAPIAILIVVAILMRIRTAEGVALRRSAVLAGLVSGVFYAILIISGGYQAESRSSTLLILSEIRRDLARAGVSDLSKVGMLDDDSYSAYFYTAEDVAQDVEIVSLRQSDLRQSKLSNFIVRNSELKRMPAELRAIFRVRHVEGNWNWLVK